MAVTRPAGTGWPVKLSSTVELAITATRSSGSARRVGVTEDRAPASSTAHTMVSSSRRAATCSVSIYPQPVTQGEVPSSTYPPSAARARSRGGPGSRPARATPARRSPRHKGPSMACRSAVLAVSSTARTTPWCCIQTNVVDRHAPARISMIWLAAADGRSRPPAARGPASP